MVAECQAKSITQLAVAKRIAAPHLCVMGMANSQETVDLVSIQWPSGWEQEFTDVPKNTVLFVAESVPEPTAESLIKAVFRIAMVFFRRQRSTSFLEVT